MPNKFVSSFTSVSDERGVNTPKPLEFLKGWGVGPVFDWYKSLPNKSIDSLQIRKDVGKAVPHRFIMAHMSDGRVHRFDRRPEKPSDGHVPGHTNTDLLFNHAVKSEDSYVPNVGKDFLAEIERLSRCEIELALDGEVDLLAVLSACYAISKDDSTREYTFLTHNCFFFSWTVLMVVSRHHLPYEAPQYDSLIARFEPQIQFVTSFIVDEGVALFLDLVVETILIFRKTAERTAIREGMSPVTRTLWNMPTGVIRFVWRRLFAIRLHAGLRHQLITESKKQIRERIEPLYKIILAEYETTSLLDENLWIEESKGAIEPVLRTEIAKITWDAILEAISAGLGDIDPGQLAKELTDPRLKFSILGKRAVQFYAVWNAALLGGMSAAKQAAQGHLGTLSDEAVFDRAWFAAQGAALSSAQKVVENTRSQVNHPKRDAMWASVWSIWDESWERAHRIVQPRSLETVKRIVKKVIDTGVETMIQEMKGSKDRTIGARISKESKWRDPRFKSSPSMTNAALQEYMQNIIKTNTLTNGALKGVNSSMASVWKEARRCLQPLDIAPNAVAERSKPHSPSYLNLFH